MVGSPTLWWPNRSPSGTYILPRCYCNGLDACNLPPTPPGTDKLRLLIIKTTYTRVSVSCLDPRRRAHRGQSAPILLSVSRRARCSLQINYFRRLSKVMACHLPRDAKGHKRTAASYLCRRPVDPETPRGPAGAAFHRGRARGNGRFQGATRLGKARVDPVRSHPAVWMTPLPRIQSSNVWSKDLCLMSPKALMTVYCMIPQVG